MRVEKTKEKFRLQVTGLQNAGVFSHPHISETVQVRI